MENENTQIVTDLRESVNSQLAKLSGKLPTYEGLSQEAKAIVDKYLSQLDTLDPQTIDTFGRAEVEKIYEELDRLIGNLKTHDISIDEMFTDLMLDVNGGNSDEQKQGFLATLKSSKSITKAARTLLNKPKQIAEVERYRRTKVLDNIGTIREKLESIRNELAINAQKLQIMAQNSATQYQNLQYQMIALTQLLNNLEQKGETVEDNELSLVQIDSQIRNTGIRNRIQRKLENLQGVAISAATKAIMVRLLAQHHEELASDYDQDLSTLLPELKGIVVTAQANESLIQSADIHNQFVQSMNGMLREESRRSKEAIQKVQAISGSSSIDVETARTLTSDVLEVVSSLREAQQEARPTNEAFTQVFEDFRKELTTMVSEPMQADTATLEESKKVEIVEKQGNEQELER
ncbi:MAG: hypothetical protein HFJ29_09650 [Clostridia bacterium]|nr:hypothetical protein [Clostridia bacterium]